MQEEVRKTSTKLPLQLHVITYTKFKHSRGHVLKINFSYKYRKLEGV